MSLPNLVHGRWGMPGSQGFACLYLAHVGHLDMVSSMSCPISGQYIMVHFMSQNRPIHNTLLHAQVTFMQVSQLFITYASGNNELLSFEYYTFYDVKLVLDRPVLLFLMGESLLYSGHPLPMSTCTVCRASSAAVAYFRSLTFSPEIGS